MEILILITVFLVIFIFVISLYYLEMDRRASKKEKFIKNLALERRKSNDGTLIDKEAKKSLLESILGAVIDIAVIESFLISADANISTRRFLIISLGMGLFFIIPPMLLVRNPFVMFIFLALGMSIPMIYYNFRRKKREENLVKQLPEAINMIARALKAGQSLDGALHEVGRRLPPPIGYEISSIYDEIAMGIPFETAIRNFEKRYPQIADIKILCTTFVIQRETGGNLTRILDGLSTTIQDRFKLKMQVKTLTAEGRITSLILGFIPIVFGLLTWFLNPKYISILFVHPVGKKLLLLAIFLEISGFYVMRKMSDIKV